MKIPDEEAGRAMMAAMRQALAMRESATPEWLAFLDQVVAMRNAQSKAEFGKPHSVQQRRQAEAVVDELLRQYSDHPPLPTALQRAGEATG